MREIAQGNFVEAGEIYRTVFDLILLALRTDTTRVVTCMLGSESRAFALPELGIRRTRHELSHHGGQPGPMQDLSRADRLLTERLAAFLDGLRATEEGGGTLLDRTMVLMGSGMGNANSHTNTDLPIILAGGGFKHGEHKQYPHEPSRRVPLCNLYLSMLQRFGVPTDRFSAATGTLTGLELA